METTQERWLPIPGHEGWYEVSDFGRVRSVPRTRIRKNGSPMTLQGCVLKPTPDDKGYGYVQLSYADGSRSHRPVHQLVLAAFVGPVPSGEEVRHLDGQAGNNHLSNLTYGTPLENAADMKRHGTQYWASRSHCKWGHEFTPENTRIRRRGQWVERVCIACNHRRIRDFYARKAASDDHT